MRQICKRLTSPHASCLMLLVVAATCVGLNTDLTAPPRFDGAGYAVLGDALASGAAIGKSTNQGRRSMTISLRAIRLRSPFSGDSLAAPL